MFDRGFGRRFPAFVVRCGALLALFAGGASAQGRGFGVPESRIPFGLPMSHAFDVDGDGDLDLVGVHYPTNGTPLHAALNDGGGRFTSFYGADWLPTPLGEDIGGISHYKNAAFADFDGDGAIDVVYSYGGNYVLNLAANGWNPPTASPLPAATYGALQARIVAGDVDVDGDADLVCWGELFGFGGGWIWLNNGAGSFVAGPSIPGWFGARTPHLFDLDLDGDLDVIATTRAPQGTFSFSALCYRNDGGTLVQEASFGPAPAATNDGLAAAGDLDGDGWPDVLIEGPATGQVQWGKQTGPFGFVAQTAATVGPGLNDLAVVDLDLDGTKEALLLFGDRLEVRSVSAPGALALSDSYGHGGRRIVTGDFDGDGDVDVATADGRGNRRLLFCDGVGGLVEPQEHSDSGEIAFVPGTLADRVALLPADLDGDGRLDVVTGGNPTPGVLGVNFVLRAAFGDGRGKLGRPADMPLLNPPPVVGVASLVAAFDADGDGDTDLVARVATSPIKGYYLLTSVPPAGFTTSLITGDVSSVSMSWGRTADFDQDGDLDLVIPGGVASTDARIFRNDGGGTFTFLGPVFPGFSVYECVIRDLDLDGDLDVAGRLALGQVVVAPGLGGFSFGPALTPPTPPLLAQDRTLSAGDLDGDGDVDLVNGYRVLTQVAPLSFVLQPAFASAPISGDGYVVEDLDGDGDADLFDVKHGSLNLGDGAGNFSPGPSNLSYGALPALADFDGDRDVDVVSRGGVLHLNRSRGLFLRRAPALGRLSTIVLEGPAGAVFGLAASEVTPQVGIPTPFGTSWLDPATTFVLAAGVLDASGTTEFSGVLPDIPSLAGLSVLLQGGVDAGGNPLLTNARITTIFDY